MRGPEAPTVLGYLYRWLLELESMVEIGEFGPKPYTPQMIEAWARLMGHNPKPHEVTALVRLSHILRRPPKETDDA